MLLICPDGATFLMAHITIGFDRKHMYEMCAQQIMCVLDILIYVNCKIYHSDPLGLIMDEKKYTIICCFEKAI